MKRFVLIAIASCIIAGLYVLSNGKKTPAFIELGDIASEHVWVYLCGLSQTIYAEQDTHHKVLDSIGRRLHIKFLAISPQHRCKDFHNKLCWPQDTADQVRLTYQEILDVVGNQPIQGFIGFSNGGFFLNQLAQYVELNKPIISIGSAAGNFHNPVTIHNTIYLLISKQDIHHYEYAIEFYNRSKDSSLTVMLQEYDGGHIVPQQTLEDLLEKIRLQR